MTDKKVHNENFEELCAAYVLNALDNEDRRSFETMLKSASESERRLFNELQAAANQLVFTVDAGETPSAEVKEAVMAHTEDEDKTVAAGEEQKSNRFALAVAASFALFIITVALVFYAFNLYGTINDKEEIIARQQAQIIELKNEVQRREELLSILSARTVDLVVMSGLEANTDGYGKVIWDPEKERALLQVSNLPPEPPGKDYQLWLIKNNQPLPAGVFSVNATGEASFFKIEELPDVSEQAAGAFAVTLEPEGGVPQPTGEMYLLGSAN